jgi:outer membrane protein
MKRNFSNLTSERDFNMMKQIKLNIMILISAVVLSTLFAYSLASAQAIVASKIAVIDTRLIALNSAVAKDINRQMNIIRSDIEAELATRRTALTQEDTQLKSQQSIMAKEAYDARIAEFQVKINAYQRDVQTKSRQIEVAMTNANSELERSLKPIYQEVLRSSGATMLMEKSMIIEQVPGLDVTTQVIEKLDIALPSITVTLPAIPDAALTAPATN